LLLGAALSCSSPARSGTHITSQQMQGEITRLLVESVAAAAAAVGQQHCSRQPTISRQTKGEGEPTAD
jgi:hypothetical protein